MIMDQSHMGVVQVIRICVWIRVIGVRAYRLVGVGVGVLTVS